MSVCTFDFSRSAKGVFGVYVLGCTNPDHPSLFTCGSAGTKGGDLASRLEQHGRTHLGTSKRHTTSPYENKVWAVQLTDWQPIGIEMAEHVLFAKLAYKFRFVAESVFEVKDRELLDPVLASVVQALTDLEQTGLVA